MPDERHFTLRQVDQARTDFTIIETELEAIHARLASLPSRSQLWRAALLSMTGGTALVQTLALLFR